MARYYNNFCDPSFTATMFGNKNGNDFEELCYTIFSSALKDTHIVKRASPEQDKYEGTDFYIFKQDADTKKKHYITRVDFTTDFDSKSYMPFIYETSFDADGYDNIKIGIRHGNSHYNKETEEHYTEFKSPVIVIGFNCEGYDYNRRFETIENNITKHASDIYKTARQCLSAYCKRHDGTRFDKTSFEHNSRYKQPEHISDKYKTIHEAISDDYSSCHDPTPV